MIKKNKAQIAMNAIFYIMMAMFMIGIIVFGIQRLFMVKDTIDEAERIEINKKLKTLLEYCNDPLNSENINTIDIKSKHFNGIYLIGTDISNTTKYAGEIYDNLRMIKSTGDNVALFQSRYEIVEGDTKLIDFRIVDTIEIEDNFEFVSFFLDGDPNSKVGDTQTD